MSRVPKSMADEVRRRAGNVCEYCRMAQEFEHARFQAEHITAEQHHGPTELPNPALACLRSNKRKGPNLAGIDPVTGNLVPLFHPRRQQWKRHFRWEGPYLAGCTQIGRATIAVLAINHSYAVAARDPLMAEGWFPT